MAGGGHFSWRDRNPGMAKRLQDVPVNDPLREHLRIERSTDIEEHGANRHRVHPFSSGFGTYGFL